MTNNKIETVLEVNGKCGRRSHTYPSYKGIIIDTE